jgi:hypothetical protein
MPFHDITSAASSSAMMVPRKSFIVSMPGRWLGPQNLSTRERGRNQKFVKKAGRAAGAAMTGQFPEMMC